jgi:hypothetical protein
MVRVPGFHELVLARLRERARVGWIEIAGAGAMRFELDAGDTGESPIPPGDPDTPPPGTRMPLRACDLIAWRLASLPGAPPFHLHWAEPRRDAALDAMRSFAAAAPSR